MEWTTELRELQEWSTKQSLFRQLKMMHQQIIPLQYLVELDSLQWSSDIAKMTDVLTKERNKAKE